MITFDEAGAIAMQCVPTVDISFAFCDDDYFGFLSDLPGEKMNEGEAYSVLVNRKSGEAIPVIPYPFEESFKIMGSLTSTVGKVPIWALN